MAKNERQLLIIPPEGFEIDQENNMSEHIRELNNGKTKEQLRSLLYLNKLINVANYLNDGWKPNWSVQNEIKYFIFYNGISESIHIGARTTYYESSVFFETKELAEQAIEILGNYEIIQALTLNY